MVEGHEMAAGVAHGVFLASPAQASAPLWLKVLVIVMGLLIVAGFVVIAAEIARWGWRREHADARCSKRRCRATPFCCSSWRRGSCSP